MPLDAVAGTIGLKLNDILILIQLKDCLIEPHAVFSAWQRVIYELRPAQLLECIEYPHDVFGSAASWKFANHLTVNQ